MLKKLLFTILCLSGITSTASAYIPDMKFHRLDTRNGLSNSQVNAMLRDSRGFTWIGTSYGLNRYDGYRIKTFYSNKADSTTTCTPNTSRPVCRPLKTSRSSWEPQPVNCCCAT